jgi:diguanylate cyclase (GGDEF)-like protein
MQAFSQRVIHAALRCGVALVCLLAASAVQSRSPFPPGSTPHFHHLNMDDGLAASSVHALAQDPAGFIWIGTDNGLQRYDGYRFVNYLHDPRDAGSIGENIVTSLAFAPDGSLWVGTQDAGLDRLAAGATDFTHFQHDPESADSLGSDAVFALLQDRRGRLWIGTNDGLDRLDAVHGAFRHYSTHSTLPNGERILSLFEDVDGRLWVGSDHGVLWYDEKQDALVRYAPAGPTAAVSVLTGSAIDAFSRSRDGRLWVGTGHGLAVFGEDGVLQAFYTAHPGDPVALQSDHVRGLLQDESGEVWVATLHGGLSRLDPGSGRFSTYQHDPTDSGSLSDDDTSRLFRDRTGLLWLATYNGGINIYNPRTRAFGYYRTRPGRSDGLAANLTWAVYKDRNGDLWVGTLKGLTRLDPTRTRYRQYDLKDRPATAQDDKVVNALLADHTGNLWVGTDYGLSRYVPARDGFEFHRLIPEHGNPYQTSVTILFEDRERRFWVGTQQGLAQFDPADGRVLQRFLPDPAKPGSLPNALVTALCETRDGALWVGTAAGLGRLNDGQGNFIVYSEGEDPHHTLSSNSILSCLATPDGLLWLGTDNGLDSLDPKTGAVRRYGADEGIPDNNVYSILPDAQGNLWLATGKGLTRFTPASGAVRNYTDADGLQKGSYNSSAAFAAADGELLFGGENGLNSFYPASLPADTHAPDVAVTSFTALGKPQPLPAPGGGVQIHYRQNILAFEFAAFDYSQPSANRFRYTLEGFDEDWHTTTGERSVTYTNLDPGDYVLRVRGSRDGSNWSEQEATLPLRVLPPPWRSWWAWVLYAIGGVLAFLLSSSFYARTIRRRQAYVDERNRRRWAEALHQLIQSVTALEDENAIAACLLDTMYNFIAYDRALFYIEREQGLTLVGSRGGDAVEHLYHERWPASRPEIVQSLRRNPAPRLLTPEEAATLEPPARSPRHYLAVPLPSGNNAFRLLLVGRAAKTIEVQGVDIAAAMAKQVSVALDKARLIKDLENLATTDGLTRLYNRRTFLQRAESEFERSRRYVRPLSVLMLDVDHFKTVNDTRGHEAGDRVLRVLADTCKKTLRQQDVTGRYGGEEFVAFLPETPAELARDVAERLRISVESLAVASPQGEIRVTVSIGVATAVQATESVAALINAADLALYEAKQKGRNRVVVSP